MDILKVIIFLVLCYIILKIIVKIIKSTRLKHRTLETIEAADRGDANALKKLQGMFNNGLTSEGLENLRMKIYKSRAEEGDINAQYWMGFLYSTGKRDAKKAEMWFLKAAKQGNVEAMKSLALGYSRWSNENKYDYGPAPFGFNRDAHTYWLRQAIQAGDLDAMCDLAFDYLHEENGNKSIGNAKSLYELAAKQNYGRAYLGLADIYGNMTTQYYNRKNQMEMLLKALKCREREIFERASFDLGNLFGAAYRFNRSEDEFSDRRKAAYCFCMSYVLGNEVAGDNLKTLNYMVTDEEFNRWKSDAINMYYNVSMLE